MGLSMGAVFYQHPGISGCLHRLFVCSISFKLWLENQTLLTVYFHFPKLLPSSDRINSLCPLRCKGEHGTIPVLRCWGTRGCQGTSLHVRLPAPMSPAEMKGVSCMRAVWHQVSLPQVQWESSLCARQKAVRNLSRKTSTGWMKQHHLQSWDQQLSNHLPLSLEIRWKITSWAPSIDILFFKQECDVPIKLKSAPQNDWEYPVHV